MRLFRHPEVAASAALEGRRFTGKQCRSRDASLRPSYGRPQSRKRETESEDETGGGADLCSSLNPLRK